MFTIFFIIPILTALSVALTTKILPEVRCDSIKTLLIVALVFVLVNILIVFYPITITVSYFTLTLNLSALIVDVVLYMFLGKILKGFSQCSLGIAILGSFIVNALPLIAIALFGLLVASLSASLAKINPF